MDELDNAAGNWKSPPLRTAALIPPSAAPSFQFGFFAGLGFVAAVMLVSLATLLLSLLVFRAAMLRAVGSAPPAAVATDPPTPDRREPLRPFSTSIGRDVSAEQFERMQEEHERIWDTWEAWRRREHPESANPFTRTIRRQQ
jgi:hypothetical protein